LAVYHIAASLYYANANRLSEEVLGLTGDGSPPLRAICIDASAIADVDFSGGQTLLELAGALKERNVRLVFADVATDVREELDRYGVTDAIGTDAYFEHIHEAMDALTQRGAESG
jgi:MFS superfamily sulfate permease-like transporter